MKKRAKAKPKLVTLRNGLTNQTFSCILLGEESIDGVPFLVVEMNGRRSKLNKQAHHLVGQTS